MIKIIINTVVIIVINDVMGKFYNRVCYKCIKWLEIIEYKIIIT